MLDQSSSLTSLVLYALVLGIGATLFMDLWAIVMKASFQIPLKNYNLVGRWVGHMFSGTLFHSPISQSPPIKHEALLGWVVHYGVGVIFALTFLLIVGVQWLSAPTFTQAFLFGILSLVMPFFIMQPCMGAGIAASLTPDPFTARLYSFIAHTSFGAGLYVSGLTIFHIIR